MDTREKYKEYVNTAFVAAVDPLVIERAEGATYYGEDGSSYIDCWAVFMAMCCESSRR